MKHSCKVVYRNGYTKSINIRFLLGQDSCLLAIRFCLAGFFGVESVNFGHCFVAGASRNGGVVGGGVR